jgi:hypothetical protein
MSEPKGLFDAAMALFKEAIKQTKTGEFDADHFIANKHGLYRLGLISQAEAAIRVLEAAGRIDKAELKDFIHLYLADLDPNPILEFMETVYMALPEKE